MYDVVVSFDTKEEAIRFYEWLAKYGHDAVIVSKDDEDE